MAGNQNFKTPFPRNSLNEYKLRLSAPQVEGATRRPTLAVNVIKNNPRIQVRTEVESDNNKGVVNAPMDGPTFYAFLEVLKLAIDAEPNTAWKIDNKNHTWTNGERSRDPVVISTTLIGKDGEGRVFIGLKAKNITPVKFIFAPSFYHNIAYKDGSAISEAEISVLYAKGYVKMLENLVANTLDTHYVPPEPRPAGGYGDGNRSGGNYNSNNKYGGSSAKKTPAEDSWVGDDMPM